MKKLLVSFEIDKALHVVCDTALKTAGMQMHSAVQKIKEKIQPDEKGDLVLEVCKETEPLLNSLCDTALRGAGVQLMSTVQEVLSSVVGDPD